MPTKPLHTLWKDTYTELNDLFKSLPTQCALHDFKLRLPTHVPGKEGDAVLYEDTTPGAKNETIRQLVKRLNNIPTSKLSNADKVSLDDVIAEIEDILAKDEAMMTKSGIPWG
jgi:hypothetical protein